MKSCRPRLRKLALRDVTQSHCELCRHITVTVWTPVVRFFKSNIKAESVTKCSQTSFFSMLWQTLRITKLLQLSVHFLTQFTWHHTYCHTSHRCSCSSSYHCLVVLPNPLLEPQNKTAAMVWWPRCFDSCDIWHCILLGALEAVWPWQEYFYFILFCSARLQSVCPIPKDTKYYYPHLDATKVK